MPTKHDDTAYYVSWGKVLYYNWLPPTVKGLRVSLIGDFKWPIGQNVSVWWTGDLLTGYHTSVTLYTSDVRVDL